MTASPVDRFPRKNLLGSSLNKLGSPVNRGKPPSLWTSASYFHVIGVNDAYGSCVRLPTTVIVKVLQRFAVRLDYPALWGIDASSEELRKKIRDAKCAVPNSKLA